MPEFELVIDNFEIIVIVPFMTYKGGVPDLYFIFYKSISCNNSAKTWDRSLEFGLWYLYYTKNGLV